MADKAFISQRLADLPPDKRERLRKVLETRVKTIQPRNPAARVPLTFGQQRIWILDQLVPGTPAYNESNYIRLRYALDVDVFRRAVNESIRRHEALRTVIEVVDAEPTQHIKPSFGLEIPLVDLRQLAPEAREQEALRLAAEQAQTPFNLTAGPLIRASLYRLDTEDFLFGLTMHHIVCDGWSMGVLAVELSILYWSFVSGKPSPLPELKIQYPDFAIWQRHALSDRVLRPQLNYWRAQLTKLTTLQLPTDRFRPAQFSFRGARSPISIPRTLFHSLLKLCEREEVTLQILVLTVFYVLLHRYSGQNDIAVGTPVAGRNRKELEPLIGFFVNTLVMRADMSGNPRFVDLLASVRTMSFAAYANQDVPFELLIEELQPVRDESRNPLVQVAFQIFQPPSVPGLNPEHVFPFTPVDAGITKFDLTLQLILAKDDLRGHIEYCVDLYDALRIERMGAHFRRLLESIVADISQPISRLKILSEEEERRLLVEWNATQTEYPRDSNIPEVFETQSRTTPEHIAVRLDSKCLTYCELDEQADRVAARLLALGTKTGDTVGLLMERCLEFPVALLGVAKSGAISVPLDPTYPIDRLSYLISDSGTNTVVTKACFQKILAGLTEQTIIVEDVLAGAEAITKVGVKIAPTDVATLMYTSGTTGKPKGVAVTHRNILRLVKGVKYVTLSEAEVVAQIAPVTFDASTFEIWGSLLNGATMVVYPAGIPSLDELGAFIKDSEITLLFITTCLFRQVMDSNAGDFKSVRKLITGGEVMPLALAKAALKNLPRTQVFNAYGPTECTTFASIYPITSMETISNNVPIGKPIENTTMFILDNYGDPVPTGTPGEIYIGGEGVAKGYWKQPEMTAENFLPDPFSNDPGGRVYRTGDIGSYREDGNILFLGRRDRQIKLSGYRIELAEVEATIARHPDVTGIAVVLTGEEEKRMTAFAELLQGCQLTYVGLREFLSELLPTYMIPSHLEVMDKLPLTPSGKVDYEVLTQRTRTLVSAQDKYVSPRNATEELLVRLWEEILHAERIGVTDNFFDLGGQSLVATRLLSRVREAFQTELTMRQFFDNPTISGLAALLSQNEQQVKQAELLLAFDKFSHPRDDFKVRPLDAASQ